MLPQRFHINDTDLLLITINFSVPANKHLLLQWSIKCFTSEILIPSSLQLVLQHSWSETTNTWKHITQMIPGLFINWQFLLSETSQVMPPSSAFLSTLLPCNFPQTNPLSSEHSMIFQTQGLNSAIILPKNNILLLIPISVLVFCCCDKTPWPKATWRGKGLLHLPACSPPSREAWIHRPWRTAAYGMLLIGCFLITPRTTVPGVTPSTLR